MSFTHKLTSRWSSGGSQLEAAKDYTEEGEARVSVAFAANADNLEVAFELDVSQAKAIYMKATQGVTVYTNDVSGGAPAHTIPLVANVPFVETEDNYHTDIIIGTTNITKLHLTQTGGVAGQFDLRVVYDATV